MNYYPLHVGDWIKKTSHLTLEEEAIYHRLLLVYYDKERPYPNDLTVIARLIRARGMESVIESVLQEFFILKGRGKRKTWCNERADSEIAKYKVKSEKARKAANTRYNKELEPCERSANAEHPQSERTANQEPIANSQEPIASNQSNNSLTHINNKILITSDWMPSAIDIEQIAENSMIPEEFIFATCVPKFAAHYSGKVLTDPLARLQKWSVDEYNFKK